MKKYKSYQKRALMLVLSLTMILSPLTSFASASEVAAQDTKQDRNAVAVESGDDSANKDVSAESKEKEKNLQKDLKDKANEDSQATSESLEALKSPQAEPTDASVWTSDDFVYGKISKLVYGCDYSREIQIDGVGIAGFSEQGEKKFAQNKEIVLPSVDDKGNKLVGVCGDAFSGKGITKVTFPTGMLVSYTDNVTGGKITKRGNFLIMEGAFSNNKITELNLPNGVLAVMSYAFKGNEIKTVTFPKTIWWIETLAFASNKISKVNFTETVDFRLEIHGNAFQNNQIKSLRIPDYTEVINKNVFMNNPGMEPISDDAPDKLKNPPAGYNKSGVVYLYTDNPELQRKDRIHTVDKTTESTHSWVQKLITNDGTPETANPDNDRWNVNDFIIEGDTIMGFSDSGIAKRKVNKNLMLPDWAKNGTIIRKIAPSTSQYGLFATETEKFDSVVLPDGLEVVGDKAFAGSGLKDVSFAPGLKEIGMASFQNNKLSSVIMPNSVTKMGKGAFASNPNISEINLSTGLTEIPDGAFGCSTADMWMKDLTSIDIPENITSIGNNAFAGNNFKKIHISGNIKKVGKFAFSTKNYLKTPCELTVDEGITEIGSFAFRNKMIEKVYMPKSLKKLPKNAFLKQYSDTTSPLITKVFVPTKEQYDDKINFPNGDNHIIYLSDPNAWAASDFTYGDEEFTFYPADDTTDTITVKAHVVTGFTEPGAIKAQTNHNLVIPSADESGKKVNGVGSSAFRDKKIEDLKLPEDVFADYNGAWNTSINKRGDFFIGSSAFIKNKIKTLNLPEGVLIIGGNAFKQNELSNVQIPKTVMMINNGAFAQNKISLLVFADKNDFPLQMDQLAFADNKIKSVKLPKNVSKMEGLTFGKNVGKEQVVNPSGGIEKASGVVHLYNLTEPGNFLKTINNGKSKVQKLMDGDIPIEDAPWSVDDFTYDTTGTIIEGLSDQGKEKIKKNTDIILPDNGPTGKQIVAIGDKGESGVGAFGLKLDNNTTVLPTSIKIPDTVVSIGKFAFAAYNGESITLPKTLKNLGQSAFQGSKLTNIVLPEGLETMGQGAFSNSTKLKAVTIPATLKNIPTAAFTMTDIDNLVLPEGVETIGKNAFAGAHVFDVQLPESLTKIENFAFRNHQIKKLVIPKNVKEIGNSAFEVYQEGYKGTLADLTLPDGLNSIGNKAFAKSKLKSLDLPSAITVLHKDAFKDNTVDGKGKKVELKTSDKSKLEATAKYVPEGSGHIVVFDKLSGTGWNADDFTYDGSKITGLSDTGKAKRATTKKLVLPDTAPDGTVITEVADNAFALTEKDVTVGKFGVTSPNGFTGVILPKDVKKIGNNAFEYNALESVDFPDTLEEIGRSSFHGNKLDNVVIPDSVTKMGDGSFSMNSIKKLKLSKGVTVIPQGAFSMNIWMEDIEIPDTVTEIGQMAFAGARLTKLDIPASVKKIGMKAFHLHRISELNIPGTVEEIGESAFEGTFKAQTLTKLTLGEGIKKIGRYAFKEGLLKSVELPKSLEDLGEEPFMNNTGSDKYDGNVVELTTKNRDHLKFNNATTHKIVYVGMVKLTFDANGGKFSDGSGEKVIEAKPGDTFEIIAAPTKEGYEFKEWQGSSYQPGDQYTVTMEDHNFTAVWKKSENPGGTGSGDDTQNPGTPGGGTDNPQNTGNTGNNANASTSMSPKTGDNTIIYIYLSTFVLMIGGLMYIMYRHRKSVSGK